MSTPSPFTFAATLGWASSASIGAFAPAVLGELGPVEIEADGDVALGGGGQRLDDSRSERT